MSFVDLENVMCALSPTPSRSALLAARRRRRARRAPAWSRQALGLDPAWVGCLLVGSARQRVG